MWTLSQGWYGDRLDESFESRTIEAAQQLLSDVGLTTEFWQLQP